VAAAASGKAGGFLALDWCAGSPLDGLARRSFALHAALPDEIAGDWGYRPWFKKITVLLNHHQIQLYDGQRQLRVLMQSDSDGKVHAFELEKIEGPAFPKRRA
jgi:hypothetical protein